MEPIQKRVQSEGGFLSKKIKVKSGLRYQKMKFHIKVKRVNQYSKVPSKSQRVRFYQRSVVKVSYMKNKSCGHWKAHGDYLQRHAVGQERKKGVGFNEKSGSLNLAQTLSRWQRDGDPYVFNGCYLQKKQMNFL